MFSRIAYSHLSSAKRLVVTARKVGRSTQRSFLGVARADAEVMRSGLAPLKRSRFLPMLGGVAVASAIGQYYYGDQPDFYDYRFICDKDPDDLADFYGSENFMDLYCVMPFMGTLMMRGGYFDEDGTVHTTGLPGEMLVSMVFSDSEEMDEDDEDQNERKKDGPPSLSRTGRWFNKRERFKDVFLGYTMWDMVTNFGFEELPDGRVMVYHHGEYFKSSIPPISLLVRLVFGIHARWVAWATEHHLNHYAFQNATEFDEKLEHESRADMPLFLLKNYAWSDLKAVVLGRKVDKPSFLVKQSAEEAAKISDEEEEEKIFQITEAAEEVEDAVILSEDRKLPFQKPAIMRRITLDINMDRRSSNMMLGDEESEDVMAEEDMQAPPRRLTTPQKGGLQRIPTAVALKRYETNLNRTLTRIKTRQQTEGDVNEIQRRETLGRENLGGSVAWEALRSTNNPEAYKAASIAARSKYDQRRATSTVHQQNSVDRGLSQVISDSNQSSKKKISVARE